MYKSYCIVFISVLISISGSTLLGALILSPKRLGPSIAGDQPDLPELNISRSSTPSLFTALNSRISWEQQAASREVSGQYAASFNDGLIFAPALPMNEMKFGRNDNRDIVHVVKDARLKNKHTTALHCLALNIYHEARGESEQGQRAVAHVVINRVAHSRFPDSICNVVKQGGERRLHRCQFSWWCDGQPDSPRNKISWEKSRKIAAEIYFGLTKDPTGGALWYHADYVSPYWKTAFIKGPQIGQHIFYQDPKQSRAVS